MAKRHERTLARRMAVQVIYQSEITGTPIADIVASAQPVPEEGPLPEYSLELLHALRANTAQIDDAIAGASVNWSPERMPVVDRAILRMAVCEMMYIDKVPVSVSINEAVELAKDFGGEDDSARFANGILGRIAKNIEAGQPSAPVADAQETSGE